MDETIIQLANAQHGYASRAQLLKRGHTERQIDYHRGTHDLIDRYTGVYAVGHVPTSPKSEWMAAVLRVGNPDDAWLTGMAAAQHCGWAPWASRRIDVVTTRRLRSIDGIHVRRSATLDPKYDVRVVDGIPVVTREWAWLDLGDVLPTKKLANVLYRAAFHQPVDELAVLDVIGRNRRRPAAAKLASALDMHLSGSAGERSLLEREFLAWLRARALPMPIFNTRLVFGGTGIECDAIWPPAKVVVEVDGPPHLRPTSRRMDHETREHLRGLGYAIVSVTRRDMGARGSIALEARLRALLGC